MFFALCTLPCALCLSSPAAINRDTNAAGAIEVLIAPLVTVGAKRCPLIIRAKRRPKLQETQMNNFRAAFYSSLLIALISTVAQAQAPRTFVSGVGDDVNPCSRTAPCKTFAAAIAKTASGGEINALYAGGFGTLVITKSITIDGTGALTGVIAAATNGFTINITAPTDQAKTVRLRGLSINGMGTGLNGINVVAAAFVSIEDCVIDGFTGNGINVDTGKVFVRNTTIKNNKTAGITAGSAGQVGLADVALVFNDIATVGSSIQTIGNVYLFG